MLKAKTLIALFKLLKKGLVKALKKAIIIIKKVKKVIIY
jgi:hypothetical protein